ncbi:restriction endonuclease subunit S [Vibrio splendidus]|uniref:restriction endonuclease subunit S n=1 Tax=Vibrio splendidus TaxID=29497 RepID=UPI000D3A1174|nr:restriction endonuclease subunit S [Vibrio splendidus]PTP43317.1 hypothetical protein CWN87_11545 [Vibrio splendidus]
MMVPMGWVNVRLDSISKIVTGKTPSKKDPNNFQGAIPFIKPGDIFNQGFIDTTSETITEKGALSVPTVPAGSIVVTCIGNLGRVAITSQLSATNQQINTVIPNEGIDSKYLFHYLKTIRAWMEQESSATTVTIINKTKFSAAPVLLPPSFEEQKHIADKLDTIFDKLEMAQSRLEKVPQLLKRFRMSVLSAAVSGELTEEWRDANNPDDWSAIKVTNIVEKIEAGKNLKCHERPPREDELGIVKISAVTWGVYDEEESKTLPDSSLFLESRRINVGDFLISRANTLELLGMPVIVHQVTKNLMLSDKVWRIIAEDADKQWLSIFLRSPEGRKQIESRATGNQESMRNIAQKAFLDIDLPMPSPKEKETIVSIVNGLFSKADLVERQYLIAKQRVDKLTQSILARAFRGELFEPFTDKAERVAQPQSADVIDEQSTAAEETALEQLDKTPTRSQPTTKAVNDKSELLSQLKFAKKAMTAQQLFDSASVETFKAIDDLFIELKRLLELNLVEKVGEGENCQFKATK